MSDSKTERLIPPLSRVQREVLTLVPNEVTPLSSRHIHVAGAKPIEVSQAVRQLIAMDLVEAEFEGIYDGVISYQILWLLPLGEEVLRGAPKQATPFRWLGLREICKFFLRPSKWKRQ